MSVPQVSVTEALEMLADGGVLLDVREPHETGAGRAPQAVCVPLSQLGHDTVPQGVALAVICRSGARSDRAAEALLGAGYTAVNITGGMVAWAAQGYDVIDASGAPGLVV